MTRIQYPYLGTPGAMRALPLPRNGNLEAPASRQETTYTNLDGGTLVRRRANSKRAYKLDYNYSTVPQSDLLQAFYDGLIAPDPQYGFVFVDPTFRNVLTLDQAACGARGVLDWTGSAGTLAIDTIASPVDMSGVITWTSPGASAVLRPGPVAVNPRTAPVRLPGEALSASLWLKTSAARSMTLLLTGYDASGTLVGSTVGATFTSSTSWAVATTTAAAGVLAGSVYVLPRLVLSGSAPTTISFAAAQLEYGDVSAWQRGYGSPRVVIPSTVGRTVQSIPWADHTLNLAET